MAESTTGPAINITDAGAGAATFSGSESRSYNYFTPKGRHASVYEDVTVDVQFSRRWLSRTARTSMRRGIPAGSSVSRRT